MSVFHEEGVDGIAMLNGLYFRDSPLPALGYFDPESNIPAVLFDAAVHDHLMAELVDSSGSEDSDSDDNDSDEDGDIFADQLINMLDQQGNAPFPEINEEGHEE